jgi:4-diphosphocytidyl-2-C-methyl-D-erythritol kinase
MMRLPAPAKITLSLHITGRRADGYHTLDALVAFADDGDWLEVQARDDAAITLHMDGRFADALASEQDNLVLRAATLLQRHAESKQGAFIRLTKQLPVAAGLGGGSADAAATLLAVNQLWKLHWPLERLATLAQSLGADVPACLHQRALIMRGIGEQITPLEAPHPLVNELKTFAFLLVNPCVPILTADVYRAYAVSGAAYQPQERAEDWRNARNDLQAAAIACCPIIAEVLAALQGQEGCEVVRLCGSGATCYGAFTSTAARDAAMARLQAQHAEWWLLPCRLG